jgi:hypothetical protein
MPMLASILLLLILINLTTGVIPMSPQGHIVINIVLLVLGIVLFAFVGGFVPRYGG